jgi:heat shock protein HslJ
MIVTLISTLALLITACSTTTPLGSAASGGGAAGSQMVGFQTLGDWLLVSLNGAELVEGSTITANFDGQRIGGEACNSYGADYSLTANTIAIDTVVATEMFCDGLMEQEQAYFDALAQVDSWSVQGATLELTGEGVSLVYDKAAETPAAELEGTEWLLDSFVIGGDAVSSLLADTAITATFADGEITGNATCNGYFGTVQLDGAAITISEVGRTMMACETGMEQEEQYLEILAAVSTWEIEGDTLTLRADNGSALVFRAQ